MDDLQEYILSYEEDLEKCVDRLHNDYATIRVGKANPKVLDRVYVDYYGTKTPLNQTANIQVGDARMLIISPWDVSIIRNIVNAINEANLGLTASDDGQKIRIVFPILTEERRKEYTKDAKNILEDCKIAMRNCRREILDIFKDMKKDGQISEDIFSSMEKQVQKIIDKYNNLTDEICERKIKDIMEV